MRNGVNRKMDRENVITHLQIINTWAAFARERDLQFFTAKHLDDIVSWTDDALALLKEKPVPVSGKRYCRCGKCGTMLFEMDKYCSQCGIKIDWNNR